MNDKPTLKQAIRWVYDLACEHEVYTQEEIDTEPACAEYQITNERMLVRVEQFMKIL